MLPILTATEADGLSRDKRPETAWWANLGTGPVLIFV